MIKAYLSYVRNINVNYVTAIQYPITLGHVTSRQATYVTSYHVISRRTSYNICRSPCNVFTVKINNNNYNVELQVAKLMHVDFKMVLKIQ